MKGEEGSVERKLDCTGMACPLPVIHAKKAIEAFDGDGILTVLVDNETAVQNLTRLGEHNGFAVSSAQTGERAYTVTMQVRAGAAGATRAPSEPPERAVPAGGGRVVVLSANRMGVGDDRLGEKLMKAFIFALTSQDDAPDKVICYNSGAYLTTEDPDTVRDLKKLEEAGTTVMTCGTCLDFYGLKDRLQVGVVSNMYDIVEAQMKASAVIRP